MKAYSSSAYARSLEEFGIPCHLQACDGWILKRAIQQSGYFDGMGCYPLFACQHWDKLAIDMRTLADELVSLVLVADPFNRLTEDMKRLFDKCVPFKEHFIINLDSYRSEQINSHHRYYARKASSDVEIDISTAPTPYLEEWIALYDNLIKRHNLCGIKAFSEKSFTTLFTMPEIVMVRILRNSQNIASMLWLVTEETAYSHLVAISDKGYRLSSSYALYYHSIEYFRGKVEFLDLGAGAGIKASDNDGLAFFKGGWANGTRTAFLFGKIFNSEIYDRIVKARAKEIAKCSYFPLYRQGEFT